MQADVKIGSHRFPLLWMVATVVIVLVSLGGAAYYLTKANKVIKHPVTTSAVSKPASATTAAPTAAKTAAAQASSDLKQIDLAQLKSSINDVKTALSGFSSK